MYIYIYRHLGYITNHRWYDWIMWLLLKPDARRSEPTKLQGVQQKGMLTS